MSYYCYYIVIKGETIMEEKYCQSCGMSMGNTDESYGTEADGSKNSDYCKHCYENGAFTSSSITMDEMIEICVPYIATAESGMNEGDARKMMKEFLPTLKRWT